MTKQTHFWPLLYSQEVPTACKTTYFCHKYIYSYEQVFAAYSFFWHIVLGLHTKLNESHYPQKKKTLKSGELSQKQLAYKNYSKTALMTHTGGHKKHNIKESLQTVEEFKNSVP